MALFVVKDGIKNIGYINNQGNQVLGTNFYLLSYDFKSNEGFIEKKNENCWRLYTQVEQKWKQSRYYSFSTFSDCIQKLIELKQDKNIIICDSTQIEKYIEK